MVHQGYMNNNRSRMKAKEEVGKSWLEEQRKGYFILNSFVRKLLLITLDSWLFQWLQDVTKSLECVSVRCVGVVAVTEVLFSPFCFRVNAPGSVHVRPSTLRCVGRSRAINGFLHPRGTACQIKEQDPTEYGVGTTRICRSSSSSQFVHTAFLSP